jgi:hypothetical protein
MNTKQVITSNDVERMLASQQIAFYTSAKQSAELAGDKEHSSHCLDAIDHIVSRYGISILQRREYNE